MDVSFQNRSGSKPIKINYSEFLNKYTKIIVFLNNTYYNGHAKDDTYVGSNAGIYKK